MTDPDRDPVHGDNAIRLTFSYEGNNIQLVSRQKIRKRLPISTAKAAAIQKERSSGFWLELTDDNQNLLHRQVMDNPIKIDTEIFSESPNESITRQKLEEIKGTFSVAIPDISEAKSLDLFSSPVSSEGFQGFLKPASKIFHIDLKPQENR